MQITRFNISFTTVFIVLGVLLFVFMPSDVIAYYEATYPESAHGDPVNGVKRSGTGYAAGDCANCHDTFDPNTCGQNDFMLFAPNNPDSQTDNFCFQCHKGTGSVHEGGITNYTYSKNFGGGTATFATIYDAFNPSWSGSSHHLASIQDYVTGKAGFTAQTNACVVCHNPHTAQDNHPVITYEILGGVNTAVRRVLHYQDYSSNLWGDEDNAHSGYDERMYDLTPDYQAPYFVGKTTYEPAGDDTSDGSNLPNFGRFCYDCHQYSNVYSQQYGRNMVAVNYNNSAHMGYNASGSGFGELKAPFTNAATINYIFTCIDCHEPHGSTNERLLRDTVNGTSGIDIPGSEQWYYFCSACHDLSTHSVIWPEAHCGDSVGCHLYGHDHAYKF